MKIIDFRLRPPIGGFLKARHYKDPESRNRNTRKVGLEPSESAQKKSIELLFEEMDEAGITKAVIVGRNTATLGGCTNQEVSVVAKKYPDRFIAVGSIEPTNRKSAIEQIEEGVDLGFSMFNMEPGAASLPMHVDDRKLYPIYAYCEDRGISLIIMTGGNQGPDVSYNSPEHIDRVLSDFPGLAIVASHANWPWVQEIIHVAYRRDNLYLSPDMYLYNMPGMDDYVRAANGFLSKRFIFGTAYPLTPIVEYTNWFRSLPLSETVQPDILYNNAAGLLGMDIE